MEIFARCLALDFDGTLVSCAPRQLAALRAALSYCGVKPVDLSEHWRLKREGTATVAALRLQGLSEEFARAVSERWHAEVERYPWLSLDSPFTGVPELLKALIGNGVELALVTARRYPRLLRLQLDQMGFGECFTAVHVVSPTDAVEEKAAVLRALAPDLFVGDSEVDAAATKLAGTPFAAVASGQRSRDYLCAVMDSPVFEDVLGAVRAKWVEDGR